MKPYCLLLNHGLVHYIDGYKIDRKWTLRRTLVTKAFFILYCLCVAVSCNARIVISAPTTAVWYCSKVYFELEVQYIMLSCASRKWSIGNAAVLHWSMSKAEVNVLLHRKVTTQVLCSYWIWSTINWGDFVEWGDFGKIFNTSVSSLYKEYRNEVIMS